MKKILLSMLALVTATCSLNAQEAIQLPKPEVQKLSMTLGNALQQRRSVRNYQTKEIDLQTLSTLLWAACGISDPASGKLTAPSAVNMQDIKVYVCAQNGVCLYSPKDNTLIPVSTKDLRADVAAGQESVKAAPLALVLVSAKNSDRSPNERYGGTDAGYVSQNIYLACTALGLKTVARGTMNADVLRKELKLADTTILQLNHPVGYGK